MDEPTSALTASEVPVLFRVIRDLARARRRRSSTSRTGSRSCCGRRRRDRACATASSSVEAATSDVDVRWIVRRMTGARRADRPRASAGGRASGAAFSPSSDCDCRRAPGRTGLRRRDVRRARRARSSGSTASWAPAAPNCSSACSAYTRTPRGSVRLNGATVAVADGQRAGRAGIAMVPEDRQAVRACRRR